VPQQSGARTKCKNKGQAVGAGISRSVHPKAPALRAASMQKRQAYGDKADDHNSDSAKEGPPKIVVGVLLLEPLSFSFAEVVAKISPAAWTHTPHPSLTSNKHALCWGPRRAHSRWQIPRLMLGPCKHPRKDDKGGDNGCNDYCVNGWHDILFRDDRIR